MECPKAELGLNMSNWDHTIDQGMAEGLRAQPNAVQGHHYAWNFCGDVWFDGCRFVEAVRRNGVVRKTFQADTLEELMRIVNAEYGSE